MQDHWRNDIGTGAFESKDQTEKDAFDHLIAQTMNEFPS